MSVPNDRVNHPDDNQRPGVIAAAATGLLAAGAALGVGELVAGVRASWQSPVVAVAEAVIDAVPRPVKDFAIEQFGENDKVALVIGILGFSVIFGAVLGIVARRRLAVGAAGFAAFAAVGIWASQQLVGAGPSAICPSVAAGAAGIGALCAAAPVGAAAGPGRRRPVELAVAIGPAADAMADAHARSDPGRW